MINSAANFSEVIWDNTETIDLTPDHFELAFSASEQELGGTAQWQTYIQTLAIVGFSDWLSVHINELKINKTSQKYSTWSYLQIGKFRIALMATENLFDSIVDIPKQLINIPSFSAHFYVVLNVIEEQAFMILRGFIRYDQLMKNTICKQMKCSSDSSFQLHLSHFDFEPTLLLSYLQHLESSSILLPTHSEAKIAGRKSSIIFSFRN